MNWKELLSEMDKPERQAFLALEKMIIDSKMECMKLIPQQKNYDDNELKTQINSLKNIIENIKTINENHIDKESKKSKQILITVENLPIKIFQSQMEYMKILQQALYFLVKSNNSLTIEHKAILYKNLEEIEVQYKSILNTLQETYAYEEAFKK